MNEQLVRKGERVEPGPGCAALRKGQAALFMLSSCKSARLKREKDAEPAAEAADAKKARLVERAETFSALLYHLSLLCHLGLATTFTTYAHCIECDVASEVSHFLGGKLCAATLVGPGKRRLGAIAVRASSPGPSCIIESSRLSSQVESTGEDRAAR